jgi:hypothetical protein
VVTDDIGRVNVVDTIESCVFDIALAIVLMVVLLVEKVHVVVV